jgi:RNA polymerase sigma-70 factor (ECF subfamily)
VRERDGQHSVGVADARVQAVQRLAGTGRDAAEELFTACYPRLTGWVRRLVDTDEDAHDIAAEAFARLLSRWSRVDKPHSYLYMIAANLVSDHWRKTGREQRAINNLTGSAAGASYHQAQEVDVRALIEALPPRLRAAFLLHHYAGFEVRQIAAMMGRPEGTIKADLHHARIRLKAALAETGGDPAPGAVTRPGGDWHLTRWPAVTEFMPHGPPGLPAQDGQPDVREAGRRRSRSVTQPGRRRMRKYPRLWRRFWAVWPG